LIGQLAAPTEDVVIFVHHPIFDCGGTAMDRLHFLENREEIQSILALAKCKITIFCGHYHIEHEQKAGNVNQYVTPSTLMQLKPFSKELETESEIPGYRLVELTSGAVQTETVYVK
jgi:3',5'-cyclic-AMP phosphodiesterase